MNFLVLQQCFPGPRFLFLPSLTLCTGDKDEEAQKADGGHKATEASPAAPVMSAKGTVGYAQVSFDLATKGIQLGDLYKRTQLSLKKFVPSGKSSVSHGSSTTTENAPPLLTSSPAPVVKKGMTMKLFLETFTCELLLETSTPETYTSLLAEMKVAYMLYMCM